MSPFLFGFLPLISPIENLVNQDSDSTNFFIFPKWIFSIASSKLWLLRQRAQQGQKSRYLAP
jgi:hypothetical protein